jgi:alkanesulfonate monooxygenase SsuD/methylene tetrahydromethanopterin reductase-like flavin-dependent oxidoreductase (luciferase family)
VLGKKPTTLETLEQFVSDFRALNAGQPIGYDGKQAHFPWTSGTVPRVWVAGYGPKALRCAGRVADGVVLQFADPDLIEWCVGFVREGAKETGRDPSKIEVMSAAPVWMSDDMAAARDHVRWFPALVSNHVMDLISRYKPEELPEALTAYVRNRGGYDYQHHCVVGSDNANFVSDEVVDRFCILGNAEQHRAKLERLRQAGVTQFNIYLMCGDEEKTLDDYQREILPKFS